jgi:hypothetical protein
MTKARDIASAAPAPAGVTSTELGYVDGVTSAIQTQVDAKIANTLTTTTGDIIYASGANTPARLGIGSSAQVLSVSGGIPAWTTPSVTAAGLTLISPSSIAFSGTSASTTNGKTVFSACTSLSLNGIFTTTYENYLVIFSNLTQNNGGAITNFRYRASGTDTTSGYTTVAGYQNAGAAAQYNPDNTNSHYCFQVDTTVSSAIIDIQNPQTATATTQFSKVFSGNYAYTNGRLANTTQYDGFTVFNGSYNFTGTVRVYGYQN